jgi:hypothetical protein
MMKANLKTWPATPVEASLEINELTLRSGTSLSCFFFQINGAAGVGRPSERAEVKMSDFRQESITLTSDI